MVALTGASWNRFVKWFRELDALRGHYQKLADLAEGYERITESHSIEEATHRHEQKLGLRKKPRISAS